MALSSSGEGQIVVYILLCGIGYVLFLWFIIRPAFSWLGRRDGSFDGHPTQTYMCAILLTVLASYWVTEQIGISGLLGVFLCGLILENGLGKVITEKIEDLVITILVPLYFATSGLKTNLGLLNSGIIWAYVVCVMVVAFCGKFFGCAGAAKVRFESCLRGRHSNVDIFSLTCIGVRLLMARVRCCRLPDGIKRLNRARRPERWIASRRYQYYCLFDLRLGSSGAHFCRYAVDARLLSVTSAPTSVADDVTGSTRRG